MVPERWEHGSDFHWLEETGPADYPWRNTPASLVGSGRDAIWALADEGARSGGWSRLWVPSYFCVEALEPLRDVPIELVIYRDDPTKAWPTVDARPGDAVLAVNTWAVREPPPSRWAANASAVIEDHSHDLLSRWATESRADYCVASLRKTLPLPDGGVIWSPSGRSLPRSIPLAAEHEEAAGARLEAMRLKARYLAGEPVKKDAFRTLATEGERAFGSARSGILPLSRERLQTCPTRPWRDRRLANIVRFTENARPKGARVVPGTFAVTLVFDDPGRRDATRERLVDRRIYPAVLWPNEGEPLSRRVLTIHADMRYDTSDMDRVAEELSNAC